MTDTKQKILDTAERRFAAEGFAAASLRGIIAEAGVNLAAVHYHFGSKEGLIQAVLARRLDPVNRARLALLDKFETAGKATVEQILEALIAPTVALARDPKRRVFVKVMGRLLMEPGGTLYMEPHVRELVDRVLAALRRALPHVPETEIFWRVHFAIGTLAHTMLGTEKLEMFSKGRYKAGPREPVQERLIAFLAAGFRAELPGGRRAR